jgi:class 3 adenylate cyclase
LVHLDIDDGSLSSIGKWPWPRATQALLLNELADAGPKVVALDIFYSEPQRPELPVPLGDETTAPPAESGLPTTRGVTAPPGNVIDHDALLEAALARFPILILGYEHESNLRESISKELPSAGSTGGGLNEAMALIESDPAMDEIDYFHRTGADSDPASQAAARSRFLVARQMFVSRYVNQRVAAVAKDETPPSPEQLIAELEHRSRAVMKGAAVEQDSPLANLVQRAHAREMSLRQVRRFEMEVPASLGQRLYSSTPKTVSLHRFVRHADLLGSFSYIKSSDGVVRNVPLLVCDARGSGADTASQPAGTGAKRWRASMSLGLTMALATLDLTPDQVRIEGRELVLPAKDAERRVPLGTMTMPDRDRQVDGILDLAWVGPSGGDRWLWMYDSPVAVSGATSRPTHMLPMDQLWQAVQLRGKIAANNAQLRTACLVMYGALNSADAGTQLESRAYDPGDATAWLAVARNFLHDQDEVIQQLKSAPPADPGPAPSATQPSSEWRRDRELYLLYTSVQAAQALIPELEQLGRDLTRVRDDLRTLLHGKTVLVGHTASGQDLVPTPLYPACPGVRVHGLVFNNILTGNFVRFPPNWLSPLLTSALGLAITLMVVRLTPGSALLTAGLMSGAYLAGSVLLFGKASFVLPLAAPLLSILLCSLHGAFARFLIEFTERKRITKRFSTYADPQLVNYFLRNPDRETAEGVRRTMTVCFTDLAGFTTLSERLGEQTVTILNDFFSLMVPIIRRHRGHLNKLLGDGMMFFFNGLEENPTHTADAFQAVLEMQTAVSRFNDALEAKGLPKVKMRVGITRGDMIAGDAGGRDFSDYTVLGDVVNLSSRLESANKATGTLIMCNREARDAAGNGFLTRPIGRLQVVGKTEGIEAFELMCRVTDATETQRRLAERTTEMVNAYWHGDFDECCRIAEVIETEFGESKLPHLYMHQCDDLRKSGTPDNFNGTIVLESK